jgi:NTP pyrophosphatase (non-canonical NTP hydrolase)
MVQGHFNRFPKGVEPFQMATRLLEECGEVANEVDHFEDSEVKILKHGEQS